MRAGDHPPATHPKRRLCRKGDWQGSVYLLGDLVWPCSSPTGPGAGAGRPWGLLDGPGQAGWLCCVQSIWRVGPGGGRPFLRGECPSEQAHLGALAYRGEQSTCWGGRRPSRVKACARWESGSSVLMFPVEELACVGQGSASGSRDLLRPQERKEREPSCQGSARGRPTFPDAQPPVTAAECDEKPARGSGRPRPPDLYEHRAGLGEGLGRASCLRAETGQASWLRLSCPAAPAAISWDWPPGPAHLIPPPTACPPPRPPTSPTAHPGSQTPAPRTPCRRRQLDRPGRRRPMTAGHVASLLCCWALHHVRPIPRDAG